MQIREKNTR